MNSSERGTSLAESPDVMGAQFCIAPQVQDTRQDVGWLKVCCCGHTSRGSTPHGNTDTPDGSLTDSGQGADHSNTAQDICKRQVRGLDNEEAGNACWGMLAVCEATATIVDLQVHATPLVAHTQLKSLCYTCVKFRGIMG